MKLSVAAGIIATLALAMAAPLFGNDWAFAGAMFGGHRGAVNVIIYKEDVIVSAGEDGFLEVWNSRPSPGTGTGRNNRASSQAHAERFQVSPYNIAAMAARPDKDEVCLVESDGMGLCRISAWNYRERRNIFAIQFREPVANVFYSMGGNFIIAAGTGRNSIVFIDSNTGRTLPSPSALTGAVGLAVTGRSERNMLVYLASGALSYWDLGSGDETSHANAPANLQSPVLFSNNRYLAGVSASGLTVLDAVSGELVAQDETVPAGSLLCSSGNDFFCLVQNRNAAAEVYRYAIDRGGRLNRPGHFSLAPADSRFTAIAASGNAIALGSSAGALAIANNGQMQTLSATGRIGIADADVSGASIAFVAENGAIGFIPLNYSHLSASRKLALEENPEAYNRITAFAEENNHGEQFVFWQDKNTRTRPVIRPPAPNGTKITLSDVSFRSPIHSAVSFEGRVLFLDATGNLCVASPLEAKSQGGPPVFNFFSVGLMDAAFIDRGRLIIGRSAVSGNAPLMMVNISTGETVPLSYPSQAVVALHRGSSGCIYAAAVSDDTAEMKTSILQINLESIANSIKLVDFEGEETRFSLAETPNGAAGSFAATIGDDGAAVYSGTGTHVLDRTSGFPRKLINGGQYLISLDGDGSICWYDSRLGKLLAVFRLRPNGWTLQTERATINGN